MLKEVDNYIAKANSWATEMTLLRAILIDCGLTETFKWRAPCYTFKGKNVILIASFKANCALSFLKGVLLNDASGILESPGENSQSVKFAKFTSAKEIETLTPVLKAYIYEAIELEKAGIKVELKKSKTLDLPEELLLEFEKNPAFKIAFEALTPGRQRGYNIHFTGSKNPKTREARINKYTQRILDGVGINDCTCGFTKRKPSCDGSHKYLK